MNPSRPAGRSMWRHCFIPDGLLGRPPPVVAHRGRCPGHTRSGQLCRQWRCPDRSVSGDEGPAPLAPGLDNGAYATPNRSAPVHARLPQPPSARRRPLAYRLLVCPRNSPYTKDFRSHTRLCDDGCRASTRSVGCAGSRLQDGFRRPTVGIWSGRLYERYAGSLVRCRRQ